MNNIRIIAMRDFRSYFSSPIAFIVTAAFLFIIGYMFYGALAFFSQQAMQFQRFNKSMSLNNGIIRPIFQNMAVILLFLSPAITMRLFAEEKKMHTIELLLTAPVKLSDIVLGKFLAAFMLLLVMLAPTVVYPIIIALKGNPDIGPIFTSYLGTILLTSCCISVGMLFSAMTENQIVAGVLSFVALLFFWLIGWAAHWAGPVAGEAFRYLSLIDHFGDFSQGLFNTEDLIFYLSFIGVSLFLTHRVLDSYRWR